MKKLDTPFVVVLISCLLTVSSSHATNESINGYYTIVGQSGSQTILGSGVGSQSFSSIDILQEYDPGHWVDFWTWHPESDTEVQNSQGTVNSSSHVGLGIGGEMQYGDMTLDLIEPAESLAWTNTQSIYSPDVAETADISLHGQLAFNLAAGLDGSVEFYFGVWENNIATSVFMLNEKDGWSITQLDFMGQQYSLLKQSFTSPSTGISTTWSLDFQAENDYEFFTYMVAEVVPEPATISLLSVGMMLVRRRK